MKDGISPYGSTKELSRITTVRSYTFKDVGYPGIQEITWGIDKGSLKKHGFVKPDDKKMPTVAQILSGRI